MLEFPLKKIYLINYLLLVLAISAALLLTRDIINTVFLKKARSTDAEDKTITDAGAMQKDIMNYASIAEKNPFGAPIKFYPVTARNIESPQSSPSELVLVGTVTGSKNMSYAIIADKSQTGPLNQEVFAYGKDVHGYGTLVRIEKGFVELSQGANIYTLPLADIQIEELKAGSSASQSQFVKKIGDKQYLLDRRKVQQSLESPEHILSDARLFPNIKNGKQEGFLVQEIIPGGIYDSLGLKNGDTLLRINGLQISNPEVAIQAMSAMRGMNTVNLDIIRGSSKMTLNYQIR
jgi:general secretion pathway protein C